MQSEIEELRELIDRLRADHSATNAALLAIFSAIPDVYREKVLQEMAHLHVQRERFVEQLTNARQQVAAERITAAQERMWKVLQEAHMRAQKPKG